MKTDCPRPEQLRALLDDSSRTVPPHADEGQAVRAHLNSCSACQSLLDLWSREEWQAAGGSQSPAPPAAPGLLRELVNRIVQQGPGEGDQHETVESLWSERESYGATTPVVDEPSLQFPGPPDPAAPLGRLGNYAIQSQIGSGAQGILFRAFDETLQRTVAIKVLKPDFAGARLTGESRFAREARAAAALNSPHIVGVLQLVHQPDFPPCMVLEYVDGESLKELLAREVPAPEESVRWLLDAAEGLQAAHAEGVVHRDIKPSNLLRDRHSGKVRITDFGLALIEQADAPRLTVEGSLAGTPAYMSPEQISRPREIDARTDLYSLGVVMYELLTGEVPFRGTVRMTLLQVAQGEPASPRQFNDRIPVDLETICLKAMARDRDARFSSCAELAAELRRWQQGLPILSRPVGRIERAWRWCRRHRLVATLSAAVGVLLLTLLVVMTVGMVRLRDSARIADQHARASADQRDAALGTLGDLVFRLQEQFEQDNPDVDELQRDALQIALDGLARLRRVADQEPVPGLPTAEAFRRMATILARLEEPVQAQECLVRAEAEFRKLLDSPVDREQALAGLVDTLWTRHDVGLELDDQPVIGYLDEAVLFSAQLLAANPTPAHRLMHARSLLFATRTALEFAAEDADTTPFRDRLLEVLGLAEELRSSLVARRSGGESPEPVSPDAVQALWLETHNLLAISESRAGRPERALQLLEAAVRELGKQPQQAFSGGDSPVEEMVLRHNYGRLLAANGQGERAGMELQATARQLAFWFAGAARDPAGFLSAMQFFDDLLALLEEDGDTEARLWFAEQRMKFIAARLEQIPDEETAQLAEASGWQELGDARLEASQTYRSARQAYGRALELFRELKQRAAFDEDDSIQYLDLVLTVAELDCEYGEDRSGIEVLLQEARNLRAGFRERFPDADPELVELLDERLSDLAGELGESGNRP